MLRSTVRHLEDENARLKEIIACLTHDKYGSGSEHSMNGTLDLAEDEPPVPEPPAPDAYVRLEEKEVQTSQRLEFVPAHTVLHVYHRPCQGVPPLNAPAYTTPVYKAAG